MSTELIEQDAAAEKPRATDLYAQNADAVREPPASLFTALMKIGPGLILAGSIVGTGELIATTHTGAKVGFGLLWLVLFSCFIKVFVQVELGRHAVSSGETTLESMSSVPRAGSFFIWWWLLMMLGTQTQLAAMIGGVAQACHMIFPGLAAMFGESLGGSIAARPELPWAVIVAVATSIVLAIGSYKLIEFGSTLMVVAFTLMTVICVAFLPRGSVTGAHLAEGLSFKIPAVEGAALAAFAMFGITGVGAAELIAYPYWCIEKGYGRYIGKRDGSPEWEARAKGWMRVMKLDAWTCMGIYMLATLAFYLLGAAVLHAKTAGQGLPNRIDKMIDTLADMYVPMMGAAGAWWFIVIGAFAVLYSTLFSATAANSRAGADFLQLRGFVARDPLKRRQWITLLCIVFPLIDLLIYMRFPNAVALVTAGAAGQALTLPMIAITALYLRYKRTDKRLLPSRVWDFFLIVSAFAFVVAASYIVWDKFLK